MIRFLRRPTPPARVPPDFDPATAAVVRAVAPFTMTSPERIAALRQAVIHVCRHGIAGAIVECGVWRGGSMMAVARTLLEIGACRDLMLFDTFAGMTPPETVDRDIAGTSATAALDREDVATGATWAFSPLAEVEANLRSTGYPAERMRFVAGDVADTLPREAPERIAVLRLDTDWYASTRHELEHLYPRLAVGGVLIVDDYGHWEGARRAVDEFLERTSAPILLNRVDYTGRIGVKPAA
jgi:hypothetical protein